MGPTPGSPSDQRRYGEVSARKSTGATYTPKRLSDFLADQLVAVLDLSARSRPLRIFDPAVGEGELLVSLIARIRECNPVPIEAFGHETDLLASKIAEARLHCAFPDVPLRLWRTGFLDREITDPFDVVVANPPYVRTQILGSMQARAFAHRYGLSGRIDLAHTFLLEITGVMAPDGVAGVIVSNRFMTTRSGTSVRRALSERVKVSRVWDFGDTRLFAAAVLPAVVLLEGKVATTTDAAPFTSIYQTSDVATNRSEDVVDAVRRFGVVEIDDGRRFRVEHGQLRVSRGDGSVWTLGTTTGDAWLAAVDANRWGRFRDIGRVRVGVKTCADHVFIRSTREAWGGGIPELVKPLMTHHAARRFRARMEELRWIVYPHEEVDGRRRAVDLAKFPRTKAYLEVHKAVLEKRSYVLDAGRQWYEIWVPQDPNAWAKPKLVFRDIADRPTFWLDVDGAVVNGDCYWIVAENNEDLDVLWLAAAVGNSRFIEQFYDYRFNNKLYSGRRRFMTQYVEEFPLPDPESQIGRRLIALAKAAHAAIEAFHESRVADEMEGLVRRAFGVEILS
jgi:hypothetical protein